MRAIPTDPTSKISKDAAANKSAHAIDASNVNKDTSVASAAAAEAAAAEARDRADLYSLLSLVFLREPTKHFIDGLGDPDIMSALTSVGLNIDLSSKTDEDIEQLGFEYVHLFLGPGTHYPPFESVQRGAKDVGGNRQLGQMFGTYAIEVDEEYERNELTLSPELKDQPDHLSAELAFMSHLCRKEADALIKTDADSLSDAEGSRELQKKFLREHLAAWAPGYLQVVANSTSANYFKQFAKLTAAFIDSEIQEI